MQDSISQDESQPMQVRPPAILWFKVYAGVLCVLYLALAAASLPFFMLEPEELDMDKGEAIVIGVLFLVLGLLFFVACLLPFFLRPRPWVWVYDLVIICLGLTSACFMIASIPLLIFWLKPEVKKYFGRD